MYCIVMFYGCMVVRGLFWGYSKLLESISLNKPVCGFGYGSVFTYPYSTDSRRNKLLRDILFMNQKGLCAFCLNPMVKEWFPTMRSGKLVPVSHLVLDHDHDTGLIRGLIHRGCNNLKSLKAL